MSVSVILAAAGRGVRMGGVDKALLPVGGRPLLVHCLERVEACRRATEIVIVAREELHPVIRELSCSFRPLPQVVAGGDSRVESVHNGLCALSGDPSGLVAIHDVARPLVSVDLIHRVFDAAYEHGAAVPAQPLADTIKRVYHAEDDDASL